MDFTTLISSIALFYGAIYFIDLLLKSCMNAPYLYFLENLGIRVQPFRLHIFSTIFNRPLSKFAVINKKCLKVWFSFGAVVIILLIVPAIILLVRNLMAQFHKREGNHSQQVLQAVVPGINLPADEFFYYFTTIFIVSIIHEVGHAIAAVGEEIRINGIGFMFIYAFPAAYVDLPMESVASISPFQQLKIVCAGVWHNVVLALFAFAIGTSLPYMLSPLYHKNEGLYILKLEKNSPALGYNGLFPGDVIDSINYCPVPDINRWKDCLINFTRSDQVGYCIPEDIIHSHDETVQHPYARPDGSVECCDTDIGSSLCFELLEHGSEDKGEALILPYSCLSPRIALSASTRICRASSDCKGEEIFCLGPSIRNSSRLLKIKRYSGGHRKLTAPDVLYFGSTGLLYITVKVTNYIPKYDYVPASLPTSLETIMDYMVKFSGALAIFNVVPCIYLDGYWISGAIIDLTLSSYTDVLLRKIIHVGITGFGTALLLINVLFGIKNLL